MNFIKRLLYNSIKEELTTDITNTVVTLNPSNAYVVLVTSDDYARQLSDQLRTLLDGINGPRVLIAVGQDVKVIELLSKNH